MSAPTDPFFVVRDEVQKSISHLEQLYDTWAKLENSRKQGNGYNQDQHRWTADEIKSSIKTIEWDIQDLEETIRIVEANPQKFKLDNVEVGRRKAFVTDAKAKIDKFLKAVNESQRVEQQRKQRELLDNPLMPSGNNSKREAPRIDNDNDVIQSESRQQQVVMQQQDHQMDQVYSTVVNLKNIAVTMGSELDDQQQLLDGLDTKVDSSGNKLQTAMNRIGKLLESDKGIHDTTVVGNIKVIIA